jgi:xanthine dehydrogenase accessory factor
MAERAHTDLLDLMLALRDRREAYALATVTEIEGSASAKPGAKALVGGDGTLLAGWAGGGCAEAAVRQAALDSLREEKPRVIDIDLNDEVLGTGMPCGGSMRVYVEPVLPRPTLWALGHGRIAECLSHLGAAIGLRVIVNDTPPPDPTRYPDAAELIGDDYNYERLTPAAGDAVVIATQHKGDHISTVRALHSPARYIAVIASHKRSRLVLDFLRGEGFSEPDLARVYAPAGLDLGARTPEEIALSVLGELMMFRRGGSGRSMRETAETRDGKSRGDQTGGPAKRLTGAEP